MIGRLKSYPAMKDPGVAWLGAVPEHWDVRKLKYVVSFLGGGTPSKAEASYWQGSIPWVSPKDMRAARLADAADHITEAAVAASTTSIVKPGAVLLVVRSGILRRKIPVAINAVDVALNQDMKALRPRRAVVQSEYLRALIQGNEQSLLGEWTKQGATVESIEHQYLAGTQVPLPPPSEQAAIVRFLNYTDRRIRRYIRAKQKLIRLLAEQKQVVIHRAVTRGLDSNGRLKPSGVAWLGDIPERWKVRPLRRLISFVTSGSRAWAAYYSDAGDLFIQSGNLGRSMHLDFSYKQHVKPPLGAEGVRTVVRRDDVLVCITGALTGNVAIVDTDLSAPAYVNQHVALIRPRRDEVLPRFLAFSLYSEVGKFQFKTSEYGGTKQGLGLNEVKSALVPIPPIAEQHQICSYLDRAVAEIQGAITRAEEEIALLQEYRTRLIADTVTGKLDVRDVAAQLPDEVEALDETDTEDKNDETIVDASDEVPEEGEA